MIIEQSYVINISGGQVISSIGLIYHILRSVCFKTPLGYPETSPWLPEHQGDTVKVVQSFEMMHLQQELRLKRVQIPEEIKKNEN